MPKSNQQLWEEMQEANDDVERTTRLFLQAAGWDLSSSHPDCCWYWTKEFNGRSYSFGREEAVRFEERVNGFCWPDPEADGG